VTRCEVPICEKEGNCNINQGFVRCRGCRMQKCLLMGMDSSRVQLDGLLNDENIEIMRRYHVKINAKQRELERQYGVQMNINVWKINLLNYPPIYISLKSTLANANSFCNVQQLLNFLDPLVRAYTRIWALARPVTEAYKNRHQNIVDLLNDNANSLLQLANDNYVYMV
jgi:hypothetical protein